MMSLQYERLFTLSRDLMCVVDFAHRFRRVNPAFTATLGWSEAELLARPFLDFVHPDDRESAAAEATRLAAGASSDRFVNRYRHRDGSWRWLSWSTVPDTEAQLLYATARDVTRRHRLEQQLAHRNQLLQTFIRQSPFAVAMFDTQLRYLAASETWLRDYGLTQSEAELLGQSHYAIFPEIGPEWKALHQRGLAGEPLSREEDPFPREDGGTDYIRWQNLPWRDEHGEVGGLIMYTEVVTEAVARRQQLEARTAALEAAQDHSRALMAALPDLVLELSGGDIVDLSGDRAVLPGARPGQALAALLPDSAGALAEAQAAGALRTRRLRLSEGDVTRELEVRFSPLGDTPRVLAVLRDVTERARAAAELAEQNEALTRMTADLQRSNAELERFAYVASHDLQEPLRKMIAFTDLLVDEERDRLSEDGQEYLGFIAAGAYRLRTLIRDLLSFSRVQAPPGRRREVDSHRALADALRMLDQPQREAAASVVMETAPRDWPVVFMDPEHLTQLLYQLISNALKYRHPDRPAVVRLGAAREEVARQWQFWVADNGIGIAPQYHAQIFTIFQRLHTRDRYSGTGIGLALCQRIVTQRGGDITVESVPGEGTTFRFTVPDPPPETRPPF